ncbi:MULTISPECIES: DnaD domain-containing protein [Turicibacter]|uniref:DNA replication protein n=1 Tax=Turicibacter faecis TaxID=2963365 RepID=A0ABM8IIC4_9FIRM|nr:MULTISPECIES: DnaD domain protein [unclassified Turicibacter]MCU7204259.1 DnaD domain protein [Turicibacter sp. TA25]MCU7209958.1 DnaD domain protein [Turicibacter sp. 1E2]BEH90492.1 DNA replication protein [Turicibacter sp. TC023]
MYGLWKDNLLDFNTLLLTTYKELGLNEQEYVLLVLLARLLKTNPSGWTFSDISTHMTIDEANCSVLFINLVERQYITVSSKMDERGKRFEEYSIAPLFEKIETLLRQQKTQATSTQREEIFSMIEQEFGILSPLDIETIHLWMTEDNFDPELIKLAIREMNSYQIKSIRYIDKILLDWKKKNIKTVEEAKRQLIAFRQRKQSSMTTETQTVSVDPNFYYDWMNE